MFFFPVLSGSLLQLLICSVFTEDCRLSCTSLFACTCVNELFFLFARDGALSHFHERLLYHSEVKIHLRIEGVRVHQHSSGWKATPQVNVLKISRLGSDKYLYLQFYVYCSLWLWNSVCCCCCCFVEVQFQRYSLYTNHLLELWILDLYQPRRMIQVHTMNLEQ